MENSSVTANVDVTFIPEKKVYPTNQIRWYKPSNKMILQQYFLDDTAEGVWLDVEIVREV